MHPTLKSLAYGALEVVTAGKGIARMVGGECIRFPARWSRYYPPHYEPNTFTFLRKHWKPGQTVFDIGAHLGLFSVLMARLVGGTGKVFSFEPTAFTRQVLKRTLRLNACAAVVELCHEAVTQTT